jgi:hypothetical protein
MIARMCEEGVNVPGVIVSGGVVQARTEASISRVPRHTGGGPGFIGQSLTARERSTTGIY